MQMLLDHGADVKGRDKSGYTPLQYAAGSGNRGGSEGPA